MTAVAYFVIALWLTVLTAGSLFLAARIGQHEDLMLDLRLLIADLNETLEKRRMVKIDVPKPQFTSDERAKLKEAFGNADDR